MGINCVNSGGWYVKEPGWTEPAWRLHHHQESLGIDTLSPMFYKQGAIRLKSAAQQSRTAWDGAARELVGASWFDARPDAWRQLQYECWKDMP